MLTKKSRYRFGVILKFDSLSGQAIRTDEAMKVFQISRWKLMILFFFSISASTITSLTIRSSVCSSDALKEMNEAWKSKKSINDATLLDGDVTIITEPFPCCVVKNFIGEKVRVFICVPFNCFNNVCIKCFWEETYQLHQLLILFFRVPIKTWKSWSMIWTD
jgi:hypothetical protein